MTAAEKSPKTNGNVSKNQTASVLDKVKHNYELLTLPLPFILWYITFIIPPFGFWPTLALSTGILLAVSALRFRKIKFQPTIRGFVVGAVLGIALFALFYFRSPNRELNSRVSLSSISGLLLPWKFPNLGNSDPFAFSHWSWRGDLLAGLCS